MINITNNSVTVDVIDCKNNRLTIEYQIAKLSDLQDKLFDITCLIGPYSQNIDRFLDKLEIIDWSFGCITDYHDTVKSAILSDLKRLNLVLA